MRNVETFVLNPQPQPYASLPIALTEAMGAFSERIPLSTIEGSENG